jgi:hypothetical protein
MSSLLVYVPVVLSTTCVEEPGDYFDIIVDCVNSSHAFVIVNGSISTPKGISQIDLKMTCYNVTTGEKYLDQIIYPDRQFTVGEKIFKWEIYDEPLEIDSLCIFNGSILDDLDSCFHPNINEAKCKIHPDYVSSSPMIMMSSSLLDLISPTLMALTSTFHKTSTQAVELSTMTSSLTSPTVSTQSHATPGSSNLPQDNINSKIA